VAQFLKIENNKSQKYEIRKGDHKIDTKNEKYPTLISFLRLFVM